MAIKSLRVEILDHEYPLRVEEGDEAFTREVAAHVDKRMRAIRNDVAGLSDLTYAVLSALAIAEELRLAREELAQFKTTVGTDADVLIEKLAAVLDEEE
jgi:cell division protein ZapA (FtsZ GTPase activity inhibitor)